MTRRKLGLIAALVLGLAACAYAGYRIHRYFDMQGTRAVVVANGLVFPWSLAFLPDGRMLVTERPGRMRIVAANGKLSEPLQGVPPVFSVGEGGLLDVVLDPAFAKNSRVYWSYAEPAPDGKTASTAVAVGVLQGNRLGDVQVIFRQREKNADGRHFGSRLLFDREGKLLITLGDRMKRDDAQKLDSAHGKIMRIETDGRPAAGNPFMSSPGALPEIWTYGHRNVQGIAFHPTTGELWATEHGPEGGDELNLLMPGRNYGWPVITYGCEYNTCAKIGEGTEKAGMEQPITYWVPVSIAPSGMAFVSSDRYGDWKGQLFIATLRGEAVQRVKIDGHKVVEQQKIANGLHARIRDIRQGPDGYLYLLTHKEQGQLIRLERK